MTVISKSHGGLSNKDVEEEISRFLLQDDVYTEEFASNVVIQVPAGVALNTSIHLSSLEQHGLKTSYIDYSVANSTETLLPSGPYFAHDNGIYEAWRLYPDELDAFEIAIVPEASQNPEK